MAEAVNGIAGDPKSAFRQIYSRLKSELLQDPAFDFTEDSRQWIERMLDYNVPGGKLNRGMSVTDSYMLLKEGRELSSDEFFLACTLGWCIEWVGLIAANDGILLRNHIPRILKRHFREKSYYVDLLDLFNEVEFQTASGQMLDLITTHEGEKDLSKYKMPVYRRIVQFKAAYYSFYLPAKAEEMCRFQAKLAATALLITIFLAVDLSLAIQFSQFPGGMFQLAPPRTTQLPHRQIIVPAPTKNKGLQQIGDVPPPPIPKYITDLI